MDNEADGEAWEKLGAIRMPENMAAEIFGNNAKYADNTTCVITENPDNTEFPFSVRFDASKIPVKSKRDTGTLAGIGMPSGAVINIGAQTSGYLYTAPYNGYVYIVGVSLQAYSWIILLGMNIGNETIATDIVGSEMRTFLPVRKGGNVTISYNNVRIKVCSFIKAVGEL